MQTSKKKYFKITGNNNQFLNIGYGKDISIKMLAKLICNILDYKGKIFYDHSKPNGTFRKLIDSSKIKKINWSPKTSLKEGISFILKEFERNLNT